MSGCTKWYNVWRGNSVDRVFEKKTSAKKHAAWLHFTLGKPKHWRSKVTITLEGEDIPFDDYEFKNGDSRKVKTHGTNS